MRSLSRFALMFPLLAVPAGAALAEDWKVAKSEEGITVSLADVPGSAYKAYRATVVVNASIDKLRQLQENLPEACRTWIHECRSAKVLKVEGDQAWTYTQFDTPWPVTPRDSVTLVTTSMLPGGGVLRTVKGVPEYLPEEKGFVRVTQVDGRWQFVPKGPGQTEVTYQVHTEPGGSVPSWVANKFVVDAPFDTLKRLRAAAQTP